MLIRDDGAAFVGDLINTGVPAVPFESLEGWLGQLDDLDRLLTGPVFQGHGEAPLSIGALADQRRFLQKLHELVRKRVQDVRLSDAEREEVVFALEAAWPFYAGVAGNTRRQMLAFDANLVAKQLGATVE